MEGFEKWSYNVSNGLHRQHTVSFKNELLKLVKSKNPKLVASEDIGQARLTTILEEFPATPDDSQLLLMIKSNVHPALIIHHVNQMFKYKKRFIMIRPVYEFIDPTVATEFTRILYDCKDHEFDRVRIFIIHYYLYTEDNYGVFSAVGKLQLGYDLFGARIKSHKFSSNYHHDRRSEFGDADRSYEYLVLEWLNPNPNNGWYNLRYARFKDPNYIGVRTMMILFPVLGQIFLSSFLAYINAKCDVTDKHCQIFMMFVETFQFDCSRLLLRHEHGHLPLLPPNLNREVATQNIDGFKHYLILDDYVNFDLCCKNRWSPSNHKYYQQLTEFTAEAKYLLMIARRTGLLRDVVINIILPELYRMHTETLRQRVLAYVATTKRLSQYPKTRDLHEYAFKHGIMIDSYTGSHIPWCAREIAAKQHGFVPEQQRKTKGFEMLIWELNSIAGIEDILMKFLKTRGGKINNNRKYSKKGLLKRVIALEAKEGVSEDYHNLIIACMKSKK